MKIRIVVVIQLANAVAMLLLPSPMEEDVGGAVGAVLEATSRPSCSLILLTDGVTSPSTILKAVSSERVSPWGVTVFDMMADALDTNETLVELSGLVRQARQVIDKVVLRESFLVPNYYIIFPERLKRYDITHIYEFSQATFSMAKPSLKPRWQSLYYPLTNQVWIIVLAVLLLMPAIFYVINTKGKEKDADSRLSVGAVVLEVMGILVGQNLQLWLPDSSNRLLLALWLVFAFIIGTAYRSNLIAALTLPKYPPRPETVEQMVDTVDRVTMPPFGKDWLSFFEASESEVYKRLAKLMVLGPGAKEGLQMATEQNTAQMHARRFMANMIAENFTRVDGSTPLYLAQESIFPAPSGWPIPHDAPYRPQLDRVLMCIIEAGLYEKWSEDLLRETRRKSKQRQREHLTQQQQPKTGEGTESGSSISALTLTHMQGPLILLFLGLVLAGMSFTGKILVIRCRESTGSFVRSVK